MDIQNIIGEPEAERAIGSGDLDSKELIQRREKQQFWPASAECGYKTPHFTDDEEELGQKEEEGRKGCLGAIVRRKTFNNRLPAGGMALRKSMSVTDMR